MATIPTATSAGLGQVRAQSAGQLPNVSQQVSTNADVFGGAQAKLLARASDALGQAGQAAFQIEAQDAALQAADIEMQAKKEAMSFFYDPDNGLLNSRGADALGSGKAFKTKMEDIRKKYGAMATHPLAQQALAKTFDALDLSGQETALRHESSERRAYASSISGARVASAIENISLNYNDPDLFAAELDNVRQASHNQAVLDGLKQGDPAYEQKIKGDISAAYAGRILPMIESDDPQLVTAAYKDYEQNADKYDLKTRLALDGKFDAVLPKMQAMSAYQEFTAGTTLDSIPFEEVFNRGTLGQESNYSQFDKSGKPLTSSAGAVGIAQVMEKTAPEAAAAAGVPWDRNKWLNDKEYNAKIGLAYGAKLRDKYGSTPMALLAYNWGQGNVDKHIEKVGDPRKGDLSMQDFIASVPSKEARNYVPGVIKHLGGKLDENAALDYASKLPAASQPFFMAQVEKRNSALEKARKAEENALVDSIQQSLAETNGDITQIPPDVRAEAMRLGKWDTAIANKGYTNPDVDLALNAMTTEELKNADLDAPDLQFELSFTDKQKWKQKQAELNKPEVKSIEDRIDASVQYAYKSLGAGDPEAKESKQKVAAMKQWMREQIEVDKKNGVKVTPETIRALTNDYIKNTYNSGGLFSSNTSRLDMTIDDVPMNVRIAIEDRLIARGEDITETKVMGAYFRLNQPVQGAPEPTEQQNKQTSGGNPFGMMSGLGLSFKSDAPKKDLSINKTKDFPSIDSYGAQGR